MSDLQAMLLAAKHLHDQERRLPRWQAEIEYAEQKLPTATPGQIKTICRSLALIHMKSGSDFTLSCHVNDGIRKLAAAGSDLPGADEVIAEQKADAERLSTLHLNLRTRLRELDGAIGAAISRLRDQSLDDRLLRLLPTENTPLDLKAIEQLIEQDHDAVADASGAWRTMHSNTPVMLFSGSSTRADILDALRRLGSAGSIVRHKSIFGPSIWQKSEQAKLKAAA